MESNEQRKCEGINPPPSFPAVYPTPTVQDMGECIGKWTYFWTKNHGNRWVYVLQTGLTQSSQTQQLIPAVWGCTPSEDFAVTLDEILNFEIFEQ
ncbi:hypothetical protein CN463_27910 [Bacillus cereus]|uniref:hypothetical protein n=1 Tax=Bacillus cereus TaxID=1396 RepID=UPI000BEDC42E|nr:hypothetical protein [Bacillus cereus]PED88620.1 hypothetical protein CON43_12145 [Bacillus cereus]PER65585.1 hypothetical protein CN503_15015 [Bacillus cereus]PEX56757.1 hypothetical protein CN463_27910 [Bacillus cereus]PFC22733.1 hypothetical protein CN264_22395 [Bacillus cereus]PFU92126.1 hypothetical protein COL04_11225 [Bacillus cereus]